VLVSVALAACGPSIDSARFVDAMPGPRAAEVQLFSTKVPACAYDEIGLIRGDKRSGFDSLQEVVDGMRARARDMGGDAIIAVGMGKHLQGSSAVETGESSSVLSGIVVRFKDSGCKR
jgi:hypothetical protein